MGRGPQGGAFVIPLIVDSLCPFLLTCTVLFLPRDKVWESKWPASAKQTSLSSSWTITAAKMGAPLPPASRVGVKRDMEGRGVPGKAHSCEHSSVGPAVRGRCTLGFVNPSAGIKPALEMQHQFLPPFPHIDVIHLFWRFVCLFFCCLFVCFWPRHVAYGILVPRPGIETMPPELGVLSIGTPGKSLFIC